MQVRLSEGLSSVRFGYAPLSEVASSVRVLGDPKRSGWYRPWSDAVLRTVRPDDVELLQAVIPSPPRHWAPEFFFASVEKPDSGIARQLARLRKLSRDQLEDDITRAWARAGEPLPARAAALVRHDDAASQLSDAISRYWNAALEPLWPRMRAVIARERMKRARTVAQEGLLSGLAGLHPEVAVCSDRISINKRYTEGVYAPDVVRVVPSVFVWPRLAAVPDADGPDRMGLFFAPQGTAQVWRPKPRPPIRQPALCKLLGQTRAEILESLDVPASTTDLARVLERSPGNVNEHLADLQSGGLVTSWRHGRTVWYQQTSLGTRLIAGA
jgi:DNA-binding transcriptional ArsR family regulator